MTEFLIVTFDALTVSSPLMIRFSITVPGVVMAIGPV
jgi:hypothetical protein